MSLRERLLTIYYRLLAAYGPQHWWPGDSPWEVIVGAILTQATSWANVEKAIANLKAANALDPATLCRIPQEQLAQLIRPCGYYNAKAGKLKAFAQYLQEFYNGDLNLLFALDIPALRRELLNIYGIGPETADCIILYAANKPIFVIDAYTTRIAARLGLARPKATYAELQALFMDNLPTETPLFNEYHALLVRLGKHACRKEPRCSLCPLVKECEAGITITTPLDKNG